MVSKIGQSRGERPHVSRRERGLLASLAMANVHVRRWEAVSGIAAIVVAALAMASTAYSAYLQRKQTHAAVWPRIVVRASRLPQWHLSFENKGVGPAIVRYVALRVDGAPVKTWTELARAVLRRDEKPAFIYSSAKAATLSSREVLNLFSLQDDGLTGEFVRSANRLSFSVCYCSIFDDCWMVDDPDALRPVTSCPEDSPDAFQE
jgi:hypothetical protein